MSITYNVLNLQQSLSQSGTAVANYSWLADGTKCVVADNTTNGYDYLGSLIYTRNGSTQTLESTDFGGGRIVYSGSTYSLYYYITDHLGSTRAITNSSGTVVERNDYYPFGGQHGNSSYPQLASNRFKYNGKELQTTGNTGFLDYGARMYDDVIGRWSVVDPMAEKYYSTSPYVFCDNNPIFYVDLQGDSLTLSGSNWKETLLAILNGLENGASLNMRFNNGVLDPSSIEDQAQNSSDFFLQDLFEIAESPAMVVLSTSNENEYMLNGTKVKEEFQTPYDADTHDDEPGLQQISKKLGYPEGKYINGNLGQTLVPRKANSPKRGSTNATIQVIINGKGTLNQRTVGIAHEFGHVILFLRGLPNGHTEKGVDEFVYKRATKMSKRLGYDF